jgi:hypothetical protein
MTFQRLSLIVALITGACNQGAMAPIPVTGLVSQDGLDAESRKVLLQAPFDELAFVPGDIDLVARVDLAAMVAAEPEALGQLDFLLRAQQPAAWELLGAAGAGLGKEVEALYLVIRGPEALVAALGAIDADKLELALARENRGRSGTEVGKGTLYEWSKPDGEAIGGHDPGDERIGPLALGVEDGLVVLGSPPLVRRALEVRAGRGRDVRRSPLAREIAPAPRTALAWAALRAERDASLRALAPGLKTARLHAAPPAVEVRAEFATADEARAFQGKLTGLLELGARMAGETPIGEALERLRGGTITVDGPVLSLKTTL